MDLRIIDLDGSLTAQPSLLGREPAVYSVRAWGPAIRLACSFPRFRGFQKSLTEVIGSEHDAEPCLTLYGSGDFHHVSLALLRRLNVPFNLLVVDNHPDWMVGLPFLHCGTWVRHAARLPLIQRVFHVGGDVDFDNYYRWLAPWDMLRSGQITVFPAVRRFEQGQWPRVPHQSIRPEPQERLTPERIDQLLEPYRSELAARPLYISVDKDVLGPAEAVVNWDSGRLELTEVCSIIEAFADATGGNLAGMDIVGDWSRVRVAGWFRRFMHLTEHPPLTPDPADARRCNDQTNAVLIAAGEAVAAPVAGGVRESLEAPVLLR